MTENHKQGDKTISSSVPMRMDFVQEIVNMDEESRVATFVMTPHPDRYTEIEKDGTTYLFDIFLKHIIPKEEVLASFAGQAKGLPIYDLSPSIKSALDYSDARKKNLKSELSDGKYIPPEESAKPHSKLEVTNDERLIAFLSVDICNSSAVRNNQPESYDQAYQLFLRELGTLVAQFNGSVLKTTGDGFIAYIDHPSFTLVADNIIDLGISLIVILRETLHPIFKEKGLPELQIRVGAEIGPAKVTAQQIPMTGFVSSDVVSDALNKAVKLENFAHAGQFLVGKGLRQTAHVQWLKRMNQIDFDGNVFGDPRYQAFSVN